MKKKTKLEKKECPICLETFKVTAKHKNQKLCSKDCADISRSATQTKRMASLSKEARQKVCTKGDRSKNGQRFKKYWESLSEEEKKNWFVKANKAKKEKLSDPDEYLKFVQDCKDAWIKRNGPHPTKRCGTCNKVFVKPSHKSIREWKKRRYCTQKCFNTYRFKIKNFLPIVIEQEVA